MSELNTKLERMTGRNEQLALDTKALRNELHGSKAELSVALAQVWNAFYTTFLVNDDALDI